MTIMSHAPSTIGTIDEIVDSVKTIDNVANSMAELLYHTQDESPNTPAEITLYNSLLKRHSDSLGGVGFVYLDEPDDYQYSEESIKEFLNKAGKVIMDFIRKLVAKIKAFLGLGERTQTKTREDLKETIKTVVSNPVKPGSYTVAGTRLKTVYRNRNIPSSIGIGDIEKQIKDNNAIINRYIKQVLLPMVGYLNDFNQLLKSSEFVNFDYSNTKLRRFKDNPKAVRLFLRSTLRHDNNVENMGTSLDRTKVFSDQLTWEMWDGETIMDTPDSPPAEISVVVKSPDELKSLIQYTLGTQDQSTSLLLAQIDKCTEHYTHIAQSYQFFAEQCRAKRCGNFWKERNVRQLESVISELGIVTSTNAKVARYALEIGHEVSALMSTLQTLSDHHTE